jgi:hypothetical protein
MNDRKEKSIDLLVGLLLPGNPNPEVPVVLTHLFGKLSINQVRWLANVVANRIQAAKKGTVS